MKDPINPSHYKRGGLEVFQILEAFGLDKDHYVASAVAYLLRLGYKDDPVQDARKAIRFIEQKIATLERENVTKAAP